MARTKQTARKSTGGRAPRRKLATSGSWKPVNWNYGKDPPPKLVASKRPAIPAASPLRLVSSAPQELALSTPDILIIILSQLPHSSLLTVLRVNKLWAGLFTHPEIQAALFRRPRPKGSALYAEAFSDILMDNFPRFWPTPGKIPSLVISPPLFSEFSHPQPFHLENRTEAPIDPSKSPSDSSEVSSDEEDELVASAERYQECPVSQQWRQLLVCQPPIEALELVQQVSRRAGGTLEFRAVIARPGGLRMGFLYDAVRHCHQFEHSNLELLWNRSSGDPITTMEYYSDGLGFKTLDDKPCVTIRGGTSVGCGQYGGLTYSNYSRSAQTAQIIESGDEGVEYCMSRPKEICVDYDLFKLYLKEKRAIRDRQDNEEQSDE